MIGSPAILILDDDLTLARLLATTLEREGYRAVVTHDVPSARRALAQDRFVLVVCDLHLPGESGHPIVEHVVATCPHTAVVVVTGTSDLATAQSLTALGVYGYLIKPFELDQFLIVVANALRRRELEQSRLLYERTLEHAVRFRTAQIAASRSETVVRLMAAIDVRDGATGLHSERTAHFAAEIAARIGCSEEFCELVALAAPLHDIGKLAVPDLILHKRGPLTPQERRVIERHPAVGHEMLAGSEHELLELAATIAWTHHERLDGTGYPRGLAGDAIPLAGQIVSVADMFDAMTSDRPYRAARSLDYAVDALDACRGSRFDPILVDALLESLESESHSPRLVSEAVA
jgi:putative two-component system response regulator